MEKIIVFFDMDGTLTPSRERIDPIIFDALKELSTLCKVGIVSGSGMGYIKEQCSELWENRIIDPRHLDIMPCNGTQRYTWDTSAEEYKLVYNKDMKEHLGNSTFKKLIRSIMSLQSQLAATCFELPLSGTFIQYRGSMLNWCMSGRDHTSNERKEFLEIDAKENIRNTLLTKLRRRLSNEKIKSNMIVMALGGECSIDIYPTGWDKTHALNHYKGYTTYFVGDKCNPGENDHTIFKKLQQENTSFETSGPKNTISIINNVLIPEIKEK